MVPAIRQSIPSMVLPSLNRVTLHLDITPRADRSDREMRTFDSEIPVAAAISRSSCWPFFLRYCRIGVACISVLLAKMVVVVLVKTNIWLQSRLYDLV